MHPLPFNVCTKHPNQTMLGIVSSMIALTSLQLAILLVGTSMRLYDPISCMDLSNGYVIFILFMQWS